MSHRHAINEVIRAARKRGWTVEHSKRHLRLVHPNGSVVFASASPSDRNAAKRIAADLRRVEFPTKQPRPKEDADD